MNKKEIFLKKSTELYSDLYDFSLVEYIDNKNNIKITCKKHSFVFNVRPSNFLYKNTICPMCAEEKRNNDFIKKLKDKYSDKYDYKEVKYKNPKSQITLICKKHGHFTQRADYFYNRGGCKECKKEEIQEKLIKKSEIIHNNKYDYSLVNFVDSKENVEIICPIHGVFKQTLNNHSNGQGCPKCSFNKKFSNVVKFVEYAERTYNNLYNYSLVEYVDNKAEIKIICNKHNEIFTTTPQKFLYSKIGCRKCSMEKITSNKE